MYKLELTEQQMRMHVTGLDSSLRVICGQITQAQSPGLALKNALSALVDINKEFDFLQAALDAPIGDTSKEKDKKEEQKEPAKE